LAFFLIRGYLRGVMTVARRWEDRKREERVIARAAHTREHYKVKRPIAGALYT
jgi:hypothetical protein